MTVQFGSEPSGAAVLPAATVVLLRSGAQGFEVLLLRRRASLRFMGGAHVFPGGKLDPQDHDGTIACSISAEEAAQRLGTSPAEASLALALHVAAARECFEEAGLLLTETTVDASLLEALRKECASEQQSFAGALRAHGLTLQLRSLVPLSRWVTPPEESRRFDTRFFLTVVPEGIAASADQTETVEALWITPKEALQRAREGTLTLVPPTYRTIEMLAFAAEKMPLSWSLVPPEEPPLMAPKVVPDGNGWWVVLPGDALHGQSCPPQARPGILDEGMLATRFRLEDGRWIAAKG